MNLVLLSEQDLEPSGSHHFRARLCDARRCDHIRTVHKASLGDSLKVGLLNGNMGQGQVIALNEQEIVLEVVLNQAPPAPLPLRLLLGLPRPKMLRRILQTCATLGVKELYLINSYRVEKSYWQTPFLHEEAIHQQLLLGLEQGCDTQLPSVQLIKRFKPFVEDQLPELVRGHRALVAHPYTEEPCPVQPPEPLALAVGPEGGFIPYEIDLLGSAGFNPVSLGTRIMRVETAIPYLLARLF